MLLCYIADSQEGINYNNYLKQCRFNTTNTTATNETQWVLVSTADYSRNDNLEVLKAINNDSLANVQALIMVSSRYPRPLDSTQPDEKEKFSKPPLISITNLDDIDTFK